MILLRNFVRTTKRNVGDLYKNVEDTELITSPEYHSIQEQRSYSPLENQVWP